MVNTERLCPGCMNDNGGEKICPICGYNSAEHNGGDCLPPGMLGGNRYITGQAKARNGEGISYIGWDNSNDSVVTLREYFPAGSSDNKPKIDFALTT